MSVQLILTTIVSGALGAGLRHFCQRLGASVWSINVLASLAIGALLALTTSAPTMQLAGLGFLAGFSTVSGQVAEVMAARSQAWVQYGTLLGMATAGGVLAWCSFHGFRWWLA